MAENKNTLREWSERLEAGERDDELLEVAAWLERASIDEPSAPSVEFRRQLRRDLLNQYETMADRPVSRLWRLAGSVAAIGLLAVVVVATWLSMSSAGRNIPGDAPVVTGMPTPVYIPTAPVDAAALGSYGVNAPDGLEAGRELEVTAHWHIPGDLGGTAAFAQLRNSAGQIVAEASGTLMDLGGEIYKAGLLMRLPDSLPDDNYTVIFGLLDAAGGRLPLYDFVHSTVIYEEATSPLIVGATESASGATTETAITPAPSTPLGYTFIDYSVSGGIVTETTQTDSGESQTQFLLVPGLNVEVITRWSRPLNAGNVEAFVHLTQGSDTIIAQSDAPVRIEANSDEQTAEVTLTLAIPADLAPGEYQLVGGLYDTATGTRLSFSTADGEVTLVEMGEYVISDGGNPYLEEMNATVEGLQDENATPVFNIEEAQGDMLVVREVSPPNGAALGGTAPVDFVVTIDYALVSLPQAILEVRVVDLQGESGRGVGLATVDNILQGTGTTTVVVVVDFGKELAGSTELGLWLQFKPDAAAAPALIEMPEEYRWRYIR
jgi:hypothetical protein